MHKVLIVDDDPVHCRLAAEMVSRAGFTPLVAHSGAEGLSLLRASDGIGAMILDLVMPEMDGMAVLEALRKEGPALPVIVQTAQSSLDTVVTAMRLGATDFFVKPVAPERIIVSLQNAMRVGTLESALKAERDRQRGTFTFAQMIAASPAVARAVTLGKKAAASTIPVLIEGESGTGKEVLARAIQGSGDRTGKPFITVNCGAIPRELVESTLFGHVKGAFTGAHADAPGKFREAHGGTLFLDEVGELPLETQAKLLRALQDGEIEPVGAARPAKVNVRVISATNRRLLALTQDGLFREDLYYRLNVFPIFLPPLRERREDIPRLVEHFAARFAAEESRRISAISKDAMAMLEAFDWPGNIRQLQNAVFRAVVLAEGATLMPHDFPHVLAARDGTQTVREIMSAQPPQPVIRLDDRRPAAPIHDEGPAPGTDRFLAPDGGVMPLSTVERDLIAFAIDRHAGRMARVARALGIGRSTLYRKLKDYGLDMPERADVA